MKPCPHPEFHTHHLRRTWRLGLLLPAWAHRYLVTRRCGTAAAKGHR